MVSAVMPKKMPTDGRKSRYVPMTIEELRQFRDALHKMAGVFAGVCEEMESQGLTELPIDGRATLTRGLTWVQSVARKAKGYLAANDI